MRSNRLSYARRCLRPHGTWSPTNPPVAVEIGESPVAVGLDPGELAAYTATAGVILNLDETISLE